MNLSDYRKRGATAIADERIRQHYQNFLLHKNRDWESEVEFRTLIIASDVAYVDVPLQEALAAVVLGELYPNHELQVLGFDYRNWVWPILPLRVACGETERR